VIRKATIVVKRLQKLEETYEGTFAGKMIWAFRYQLQKRIEEDH